MHTSSYEHMTDLVARHLPVDKPLRVMDIGSYDVNGSYKPLFAQPGWHYLGVDLEPGPNVDMVLNSPYQIPMKTGEIDLVISGQAFEHVEYFWLSWLEMARILKPGGQIFLIAPSRGPEHRYPVDCWRFYPDGYRALAKFGGLDLIEVSTDWEPNRDSDSAQWGDTVGVFRQPVDGWYGRLKKRVKYTAGRILIP